MKTSTTDKRIGYVVILFGLLAMSLVFMFGCPSAQPIPSDMEAVKIGLSLLAEGFTSPLGLIAPNDGTNRLFVHDQVGKIHIIDAGGNLLTTPFLDISALMVGLRSRFDERGLLSLAFHPNFANNGRFFVVYNAPLAPGDSADFDSRWRLSEFRVSAGDPNLADPNSEIILLEVLKPQFNHNGGQIAFSPDDGYLYASIGDGGGADDVGFGHNPNIGNAQDVTQLLGKILRFDVSTVGVLNIPANNPFVNDAGVRDEIYAYGLRNPWRFSFDMGGQHRLFCADAGQNLYEEISIITAGGNFGWNLKEGSQCFDPNNPDNPPTNCSNTGFRNEPLIDPIIEYSHFDALGSPIHLVVIGGYVYRGSAIPELTGQYIFGDWSSNFGLPDGTIFVARENANGSWSFVEAEIVTEENRLINRYVLAFGQDTNGEVYVLTTINGGPTGSTGQVFKIVSPS
ncbi:MAG: PQQ-dependent sugar dehydrogenase [Planctomycetota bacterium]|jgi:glucose/arabinose dehydrogenase